MRSKRCSVADSLITSVVLTKEMATEDVDVQLAEEYRLAERRFLSLAEDVHLPQLDVEVYTKYYIKVKSRQRLDHLMIVIDTLDAHRLATLRILKLIHEREEIIQTIVERANDFASKKITTLDAQTTVLQLLYRHQQVSLKIVESVFAWREALTRPYPFQFRGQNYFLKILSDCEFIDSCSLKAVLPLRVAQFPLCSNISALKMFDRSKDAAQKSVEPTHTSKKKGGSLTSPRKDQHSSSATAANVVDGERLRGAESMLFAEKKLQVRVMKELATLANHKQFVTLLNVVRVVPNCSTGILVTDPQWETKLREWMQRALAKAEKDVTAALHSASSSPSHHEAAPPDGAGPANKHEKSPASSRSSSSSSSRSSRNSSCSSARETAHPPQQTREAAPTQTKEEQQPHQEQQTEKVRETKPETPINASGKYDEEFEDDD